ncbi:MAG: transketolase [bacterium]|nr:transketolase [bacterium]
MMRDAGLSDEALRAKARWVWRETLRLHRRAPETRVASSLSCVEILCALMYGGILRFDPRNPRWEGRDRLVISKAHGSISFYPILADLGFVAVEELERIARPGGVLKVIPDPLIAGYETLNGSVGLGLGVGVGLALGLRRRGARARVMVLCGDGELFAGASWEAIMLAPRHGLGNLCIIVDRNGLCMLERCSKVADLAPLEEKLAAFGWRTASVNGHDVCAVRDTLRALLDEREPRPKALLADTVKGHGVPQLEGDELCHIRSLAPEVIDALLREGE